MGHANIKNLSEFWINLLYARGKLTIGQAVAVAKERGETLHASGREYDADSGMVGYGFEECCTFLSCDAAEARANWGWHGRWDGPFIEPILDVEGLRPRGIRLDPRLSHLLATCRERPDDADIHGVTGDRLEEEGFIHWAAYVRDLPKLLVAYERWHESDATDDWWVTIDRIPWRFCRGKRATYRDIPRLASIIN